MSESGARSRAATTPVTHGTLRSRCQARRTLCPGRPTSLQGRHWPKGRGRWSALSLSDSEKVAKDLLTIFGKDGFGMELHTPHRMTPMSNGVDLRRVIAGASHDLQLSGHRPGLDHQRMIPHYLEGTGHVGKDPLAVVRYARGFAVHQLPRAHHPAAVGFADSLMSETDTEVRDRAAPLADRLDTDPRFGRCTGSGRDHHAGHAHATDVIDGDLVVALHDRLLAELAQVLNEVVRERVVVVEDEQHAEF